VNIDRLKAFLEIDSEFGGIQNFTAFFKAKYSGWKL
jgi:hypothetical protein